MTTDMNTLPHIEVLKIAENERYLISTSDGDSLDVKKNTQCFTIFCKNISQTIYGDTTKNFLNRIKNPKNINNKKLKKVVKILKNFGSL